MKYKQFLCCKRFLKLLNSNFVLKKLRNKKKLQRTRFAEIKVLLEKEDKNEIFHVQMQIVDKIR